jgi:hypothetical protein
MIKILVTIAITSFILTIILPLIVCIGLLGKFNWKSIKNLYKLLIFKK